MSANTEAIGPMPREADVAVKPVEFTVSPPAVTEVAVEQHYPGKRQLAYYATSVLLAATGVAGAAAGGAIIGATRPVEIQPTEHISATLQLRQSPQADFTLLQPELTVHDKQLASNLPIVGSIAPHIRINKFDYAGFGELPGVLSDYDSTIRESRRQIAQNARAGGLIGGGLAITGGLAAAGIMTLDNRRLKRRRHEQQAGTTAMSHLKLPADDSLANELHSTMAGLKSLAERQPRRSHRVLLCGALAISLVAGASLVAAKHELSAIKAPQSTAADIPLPPSLIQLAPPEAQSYLSGITVSGSGGHLINQAARFLLEQKHGIDAYWQNVSQQTTEQFNELREQGKLLWENDPNKVSVLAVSDIHGNMSFMDKALPGIINASQADIVANAGDQENTGGNFIMDDESLRALVKSVDPNQFNGRKAPLVVFVSGNHDSAELPKAILKTTYIDGDNNKYHPIIPLTKANGYRAEIDGLTFVGGPDPNSTTTGPTVPFSPADQLANSAKLGQTVTDTACQAKAESGINPIVMTHEREAGYQALADGCASIAISGHLHSVHKPLNFNLPGGSYGYLENLGSASGDGPNNPTAIYNRATTPGNAILNVFDKTTGLLTDFVTITYTPGGQVEVKVHSAINQPRRPGLPTDNRLIQKFLGDHNLLPQLQSSADVIANPTPGRSGTER